MGTAGGDGETEMLWLVVSLGCWIGFVLLVGYVRRLRASEADPGGPTGDPLWPGPVAIVLVLGALAGGIAALVGGLPIWGLVLAGASAMLAAGMILWAVRDLAVEKS
jgi:hypothetical protein